MATFYCIDLDMTPREDFVECATRLEANSERDAAVTMAIFEDEHDGSMARIMVADNPEGADAVVFTVTQRVDIRYEIDEQS